MIDLWLEKFRAICVRFHTVYLSLDDLESEKKVLRLEHRLLVAMQWLGEKKFEAYSVVIKALIVDTKKLAKELRRTHGESVRGKLRRIAEELEHIEEDLVDPELCDSDDVKESEQFKIYKACCDKLESVLVCLVQFTTDDPWLDEDFNPWCDDTWEKLPSILLELGECHLLLLDRYVRGLRDPKWEVSKDIVLTFNDMSKIAYEILDVLMACTYKCSWYEMLLDIQEFNQELSKYYLE